MITKAERRDAVDDGRIQAWGMLRVSINEFGRVEVDDALTYFPDVDLPAEDTDLDVAREHLAEMRAIAAEDVPHADAILWWRANARASRAEFKKLDRQRLRKYREVRRTLAAAERKIRPLLSDIPKTDPIRVLAEQIRRSCRTSARTPVEE